MQKLSRKSPSGMSSGAADESVERKFNLSNAISLHKIAIKQFFIAIASFTIR